MMWVQTVKKLWWDGTKLSFVGQISTKTLWEHSLRLTVKWQSVEGSRESEG